jgi:S1-C subfamily serine protease
MRNLWVVGLLLAVTVSTSVDRAGVKAKIAEAPVVVYGDGLSVAERILSHSVVILYETLEGKKSLGSGVLYKKNGSWFVITAAHVVQDEKEFGKGKISVAFTPYDSDVPTHAWKGILLAHNESLDAAVIGLEDAKDLKDSMDSIFDRNEPRIGKEIYAVGNPLGEINTVTDGIISNNRRKVEWAKEQHIQITANGAPGSSGGGVFTKDRGECIGIVVRINYGTRILMVVPTNRIFDWLAANNLSTIAPD